MQRHAFDSDWLFDLGDAGEPGKNCNDASWRRRGLVVLRPKGPAGDMVLHAVADGLKSAKVTVATAE